MIEVSVYDSTGTLLDVVLDAIDPQFQEQLNNPGSYQFNLHVDSDTLERTPALLDYGNIVKLTDGKSGHVFAGIIEAKQRKLVADRSAQVWQVFGRGYLAALQDAVVYPEYGLVRFRGDSRPFNFASLDGPWRVTSEWAEPMFGPWGSSDVGFRKGSPADWPDPQGEWMWPSPGPTDLNMPEETAHFRRQFTTATTAMYRFYCTGDNEFDLWVNGEMVLSGNDWGTTYSVDVWVPAGNTLVAIEGRNWPQLPSTTSTAGVLFAMYSIAGDGTTGSIQRRSTSGAGWIAWLDNPDPPGWNPGQVLSTLIAEAQNTARGGGVAALAPMTVTWTDTADTDGNPWTTIVDRTFPIGADYLDVATQLAELGVDIRVNGETLALEMRQHQGVDRTTDPGGVVLSAGGSLTDADYQGDASAERSTVLVQGADGRWYERGIVPSPPRREAALQVGNATSQRQVDLVVDQTLAANGSPAEQYTATAADTGPIPFSDFAVGDNVLIPDVADGTVGQRVMAITAKQQDRTVTYTPELGAILKSREQRQAQALTSVGVPSLGGRVTNTSPVTTPTRVQAAVAGAASSSTSGADDEGFFDDFTSLADGTRTVFTLSHIPRANLVWLKVRGLGLLEGVDYTIDYATGKITLASAPPAGDEMWARYLSYGQVPPQSASGVVSAVMHADNGVPPTLTLADATQAGDTVIVFATASADVTAVSGLGATWTKVDGAVPWDYTSAWVGQGCTAGQTAITITAAGATEHAVAALLLRGAHPVASHIIASGSAGADPTTGQVTVTSSQIAVGYWHDGWPDTGALADTPADWDLWFPTSPVSASFGNANVMYPAVFVNAGTAEHKAGFASTEPWWGVAIVLDRP